jgi:hypothetical protein
MVCLLFLLSLYISLKNTEHSNAYTTTQVTININYFHRTTHNLQSRFSRRCPPPMPTDVTVGHYPQDAMQAPYMNMNQGGWATSHSLPAQFPANPYLMTGPARAIDCLPNPTPNAVMAKGVRNPYVPYMGETYRPAAESAANRHALLVGGSSQPYASGMGMSMPMGGGMGMGGGSMISPSVGGGSVMSTGSAYGGPGGCRMDDGWEGSMGRSHVGHAPDLSSTAGAIPRRPIGPQIAMGMGGGMGMAGGGGMSMGGSTIGYHPSSPLNHRRMSPSSPHDYAHIPPPGPPIHRSSSQRVKHGDQGRRVSISNDRPCHECDHKPRGGRRMSDGMLPGFEGSPLRQRGGEDLRRKVSDSGRSRGRRDSFSSER